MELLFRAVVLHIRERLTTKMLVIMKMVVLLLTVACLQISARTLSQTISLSERDAPLEKVFKEIEKQTNYHFFYRYEWLKDAKKVSIQVKGATLQYVLDQVFKDQPLTYVIVENNIAIKLKEENKSQNTTLTLTDIRGKVVNEKGEPIAGATVQVKGTNRITVTDENGAFQLTGIADNAVLVISSVSFETMEVNVEGKPDLAITLKMTAGKLETVNVTLNTGYQSIPKERATGSFAQPIMAMYNNRVAPDVISKLDAITSGLVFNSPQVAGTSTPKMSIRGRSTIYANDDPLIVVDNFPYDGDINNINPNDVESITVLKDAAAASIWGVRAGNGVIVITTKQGKSSQPLRLNLNANVTISKKPDLFYDLNFLNARDFISVETNLFDRGFYDWQIANPSTPISPVIDLLSKVRNGTTPSSEADAQIDRYRSLDVRDDLAKYFYRSGVNQQYALNVSGGTAKSHHYFSAGYDQVLANEVGTSSDRITINSFNSVTLFKNFEINAGLNFIEGNKHTDNSRTQIFTGGTYHGIYPYAQLAEPNGAPTAIVKGYSSSIVNPLEAVGFRNWQFFPVQELRSGWNRSTTKNDDIRLIAGANLKLFKGLSAEFKYQYQKAFSRGESLANQESFYSRNLINQYSKVDAMGNVIGYNLPVGSILNSSYGDFTANNARIQLNYTRNWERHSIAAIGGYESRQIKTTGNSSTAFGYNEENGSFSLVDPFTYFPLNPNGYTYNRIPVNQSRYAGTLDRYRSYFANAAYTYANRYTLSASGRIDGSNYFAVNANQKNVPLWSVGGKWEIDKEGFYHLSWLPSLSLRATYGYNGNLDKNLTAITTLYFLGGGAPYSNFPYSMVGSYGNPELRWEKTGMTNIGVDFALLKNKLSGSVEYYSKQGVDLIGFSPFAPSTGIVNSQGNYSSMKGQGVDIQLAVKTLDRHVKWTTTFLFSWATDKVTKYEGTNILPSSLPKGGQSISPVIGKPVFAIYGFKWAGLDPANGDPQGYDKSKLISKDYALLTRPDSVNQLAYYGPARPVFFGGLNNRISYDRLTLSFNISYKLGYYFFRNSIYYNNLYNNWVSHEDYERRWQKTGDEKNTNVPSAIYPADANRDYFYNFSEALICKGDHIRLQDISLSYDLSTHKLFRIPIDWQFYVYANNVVILWKANNAGIDPDYPTGGFPSPRTIAFGIKVGF